MSGWGAPIPMRAEREKMATILGFATVRSKTSNYTTILQVLVRNYPEIRFSFNVIERNGTVGHKLVRGDRGVVKYS